MQDSIALLPFQFPSVRDSRVRAAAAVALGVALLSALSVIRIPLPFTPVPVTGQTFGVTLLALLYGRRLGALTVGTYLIGALAMTGPGPTVGYLVGMGVSALLVGALADRGATASLRRTLLAGACGSLCVHAFGLAGLAFYLPTKALFWAGSAPFLPGDVVKTTVACLIARGAARKCGS